MTTYRFIKCPGCGKGIRIYANPIPTVDIIIEINRGIVLINRKNPPYGWALPGGFVDYGESLEEAAVREAMEETTLSVNLSHQLGTYSAPQRDPRQHSISTVFIASASGSPRGNDDAQEAVIVSLDRLPKDLAFDHGKILEDYLAFKKGERSACPVNCTD